jgi:hypothetical protein
MFYLWNEVLISKWNNILFNLLTAAPSSFSGASFVGGMFLVIGLLILAVVGYVVYMRVRGKRLNYSVVILKVLKRTDILFLQLSFFNLFNASFLKIKFDIELFDTNTNPFLSSFHICTNRWILWEHCHNIKNKEFVWCLLKTNGKKIESSSSEKFDFLKSYHSTN